MADVASSPVAIQPGAKSNQPAATAALCFARNQGQEDDNNNNGSSIVEQVLQHGQASQSSGLLPSFCASQAQDKRPPADPPTRPLLGRIKEGPP